MSAAISRADLPIGVFDSGVGGLTVLRELRSALPNEHLVYLGDTARVPYGTKSPESVTRYALQAARALVGRGIKLLVVACNTVSAVALDALAERHASLPVVGVVLPGAEAACRMTRVRCIGVIGTESTVRGGAYQRAIAALIPDARVVARPCSLFVALAEEGWVDGPLVEGIIARYLGPMFNDAAEDRPDCLVLGCTHFPVLAPAIRNVLGDHIALVDSAATTAAVVRERLASTGLTRQGGAGDVRFLATDGAERFRQVGEHFFGAPIARDLVELTDL
jgi:glutamate racemase